MQYNANNIVLCLVIELEDRLYHQEIKNYSNENIRRLLFVGIADRRLNFTEV